MTSRRGALALPPGRPVATRSNRGDRAAPASPRLGHGDRAALASPRLGRADRAALVSAARNVRGHAYAQYSQYRVGAAVLTRRGALYVGCNVENATYGATLCAERAAIAAMVAAGDASPIACAVATGGPIPGAPCGICRQVLSEFASDMVILLVAEDDSGAVLSQRQTRLRALLPQAFRLRAP